jgi:hypothetical protein
LFKPGSGPGASPLIAYVLLEFNELVIICGLFFEICFLRKFSSSFQYVYFPSRSSNPYKALKSAEEKAINEK